MPELPDERVFQGIKVLLEDYALIKDNDTFVITYTPDSREPAAWIALALQQRRFHVPVVAMLPLQDDTFGERLAKVLPDPNTLPGRLVVFTLELDSMSHFNVFEGVLRNYGHDRTVILRIISAATSFFTDALNLTPTDLSALNASLLHRLRPARKTRVRTDGGTDLTIELDSERFQWISNRGVLRPGGFTILPAGEVATYPARVDGEFVADGAFNANIKTSLRASLSENPVHVTIENNKAVNMTCADPQVRELLQLCLDSPNGRNVGEYGLGTNHGIPGFITANSHINERRCGVHIGFGQHNQSLSRVPYVAEVHLDLITAGARVWLDSDPEPIDLERVTPTSVPHPTDALDEDITGDCCGLGYGHLRGLAASNAPDVALPGPPR
jgi:hypothetical protein